MSNFVKIELRGFKSFADKVEIPFNDGVTAIIGPNGCGKSNVADAIRWTLGEMSAKSLRGKTMQDVIFAGTEKRKSMSYCEVSLYFNNENQKIFKNLPYEEVVITRKLDRSGSSEYFINRTRCLKADIVSLFRDTGVGKEGYSIIGQGRVAEIMSAKPDERRKIFEEAAGISAFRADRNDAVKKLDAAKNNLQTANEIIAEIERQLTPLRRQAETAKKYFELREQLKVNEVNLYIYNFENNQSIKQKIYDRLSAYEKDLKIRESQFDECAARYDECLRESGSVDRDFEDENAELMSLKIDAERVAGQANVIKERITHLQTEISRLNDELRSVDSQLTIADGMIKNVEDKKESELKLYLDTSNAYSDASDKLEFLNKSLKGQESDLETRNSEYVRAIEELGALKSNFAGYVAEKGINEERAKNMLSLINSKKEQLDEELTALSISDGNLKSAKERNRALITEYNETLSEKAEQSEAIKAYSEDLVSLNSRLGFAEGQLQLAVSSKNDYSGYLEAVKRLMRDAKSDPVVGSKILGVIAEIINVPSEYESAIEYALAGALQNVVVETERDAGDIIAYLKQKNYGRVSFRPLTSARPRSLYGQDRAVLDEPGCFGIASDLVDCEKKFEPVIQGLLGSTVVVDNINNAIRLYKKYNQAFRIVTIEGEIFSPAGDITGGSRRQSGNAGLLSQEKQIEQAKTNLEKIKSNISALNANRGECERRVAELDEKISELNKEMAELRGEITVQTEKSGRAFEISEKLKVEVADNAVEYDQIRAEIKQLAEKIESMNTLEKTVKEKQSQYSDLLLKSKSVNNEQKNETDELRESATLLRVKMAEHKSALDGYEAELFRIGRERQNTEEEKLDIITELRAAESNLNAISSAPEKTKFSEADSARIAVLENSIAGLSEKKKRLSEEVVRLDAEKTEIFNARNVLSEKKIRDEGMLENVDIEIRHQQEHILEEYNLTYTDALEFKDDEYKSYGALTVIGDLKKSISRLGEVNTLAVETLIETEERYEKNITVRNDIQNGYDDVIDTIKRLTDEMRIIFTEAFDKINENFQEVFEQLFGGGRGELRLNMTETDDPLEAGIEIFAQPPGKTIKNLSSLSGGEQTYTSIGILFAILKLKPMPFCVLDEIDAALDDSNANLFADFLNKFSDFTQFIVITHRKPTMRHADTIFGVTMEEKGITKVVSIEFEDAVKHALD